MPLVLLVSLLAGRPDDAGWAAHVARLERAEDAESALRLAAGHAARGTLEDALRWARTAADRGAHAHRVSLVRGDAFLRAERWEEAITAFFEVVQDARHHGYAHVRLWECLRRAPSDAIRGPLDLPRIRVYLARAGFFLPEKPHQPPVPEEAAVESAAGYAALQADREEDAASRFRAAIHADPGHAEAYRGLGLALARLRQPQQALGAYRLYLALAPRETRDVRVVRQVVEDEERRRGLAAAEERSR